MQRFAILLAFGFTLAAPALGQNLDLTELRQQAEQGIAEAQHYLGIRYETGDGVPENDAEAFKWYLLAAEQGYAESQATLGAWYSLGMSVPENDAEAFKWYLLAAEQGVARAQSSLGGMYADGEGVPENGAEAVKWYSLAAEQGDVGAQSALITLYISGEVVPEDLVLAYAWANILATQWVAQVESVGDPNEDVLNQMRNQLSEAALQTKAFLRERMTADQITQAQEMSSTLFDRINWSR